MASVVNNDVVAMRGKYTLNVDDMDNKGANQRTIRRHGSKITGGQGTHHMHQYNFLSDKTQEYARVDGKNKLKGINGQILSELRSRKGSDLGEGSQDLNSVSPPRRQKKLGAMFNPNEVDPR